MPDPLRVLLIEDCEAHARLVELLLGRSTEPSFAITRADRLSQGVALIHDEHFDVVLLDLGLPDGNGLEVVKRVRSASSDLPIVVQTANDDEELALQAITSGAQEYLSKDHLVGQLLTRVIRHSIARQKQLLDAQAQALTDALTGLSNRRYFDLELRRRIADSNRFGHGLGMILLDIDHFKAVNDTHGHDAGDEVLRALGGVLRRHVRASDLVARIGGEEFAVLMSVDETTAAMRFAERIRLDVGELLCQVRGVDVRVTISGGLALFAPDEDGASFVRRVDEALYRAKLTGRNCIQAADVIGPQAIAAYISHA